MGLACNTAQFSALKFERPSRAAALASTATRAPNLSISSNHTAAFEFPFPVVSTGPAHGDHKQCPAARGAPKQEATQPQPHLLLPPRLPSHPCSVRGACCASCHLICRPPLLCAACQLARPAHCRHLRFVCLAVSFDPKD